MSEREAERGELSERVERRERGREGEKERDERQMVEETFRNGGYDYKRDVEEEKQ